MGTNCRYGKITCEVFTTKYFLYFNSNWGHNSAPMTLPRTWTSSNKNTKKLLLHQLLFMARTTNQVRFFKTLLQVNLCQKLFFLQNMGRVCCVQKLFWMSETISVHNMFSPGFSLKFSCIELLIQWRICRHIVA